LASLGLIKKKDNQSNESRIKKQIVEKGLKKRSKSVEERQPRA
jgi:hypothetical protein